ncbi:hypothetical protein OG21DRAFT_451815 [Imleria badia]|nr:hypothetical protein OG21DRAFT_451815 [Imleria badia]
MLTSLFMVTPTNPLVLRTLTISLCSHALPPLSSTMGYKQSRSLDLVSGPCCPTEDQHRTDSPEAESSTEDSLASALSGPHIRRSSSCSFVFEGWFMPKCYVPWKY